MVLSAKKLFKKSVSLDISPHECYSVIIWGTGVHDFTATMHGLIIKMLFTLKLYSLGLANYDGWDQGLLLPSWLDCVS